MSDENFNLLHPRGERGRWIRAQHEDPAVLTSEYDSVSDGDTLTRLDEHDRVAALDALLDEAEWLPPLPDTPAPEVDLPEPGEEVDWLREEPDLGLDMVDLDPMTVTDPDFDPLDDVGSAWALPAPPPAPEPSRFPAGDLRSADVQTRFSVIAARAEAAFGQAIAAAAADAGPDGDAVTHEEAKATAAAAWFAAQMLADPATEPDTARFNANLAVVQALRGQTTQVPEMTRVPTGPERVTIAYTLLSAAANGWTDPASMARSQMHTESLLNLLEADGASDGDLVRARTLVESVADHLISVDAAMDDLLEHSALGRHFVAGSSDPTAVPGV